MTIILQAINIILFFIVSMFLYRYLPSYFGEKGKNLATKEDIGEITKKVEEVRQVYTSELEILKAQLKLTQAQAILYSTAYIERVTKLWSKLQELKNIGEQLWEAATPRILSEFSQELSSTKLMLEKSSLFLSLEEYSELKDVLNKFERFKLGKETLINFRTSEDVERALENLDESPGLDTKSDMIEEHIVVSNGEVKDKYEGLLNDLGKRLRLQLNVSLPKVTDKLSG